MEDAHASVRGAHQLGPKLHDRVKRMGYYWPTMVCDCIDFAKRCDTCQLHANFIHQPLEPLLPTIAFWCFEAWGLDVVGLFTLKSSAGHMYILTATDYFSKWAEAIALKEVKRRTWLILFEHTSFLDMVCLGISSQTTINHLLTMYPLREVQVLPT